jgi:hypothetical protein
MDGGLVAEMRKNGRDDEYEKTGAGQWRGGHNGRADLIRTRNDVGIRMCGRIIVPSGVSGIDGGNTIPSRVMSSDRAAKLHFDAQQDSRPTRPAPQQQTKTIWRRSPAAQRTVLFRRLTQRQRFWR